MVSGGGKARRTGADDDDINIFHDHLPRHNNHLIVGKFRCIGQRGAGGTVTMARFAGKFAIGT